MGLSIVTVDASDGNDEVKSTLEDGGVADA